MIFPYVSRETWFTRFWQLYYGVCSQDDVQTDNDARVAAALLTHCTLSFKDADARYEWMEEWLQEVVEAQRVFVALQLVGGDSSGLTRTSARPPLASSSRQTCSQGCAGQLALWDKD